jgi:hypothetical protein
VGVIVEIGRRPWPHKVLSQLLLEDTEGNKSHDISKESNPFFHLCICLSVHPHLFLSMLGEREEKKTDEKNLPLRFVPNTSHSNAFPTSSQDHPVARTLFITHFH